MFAKLKAIREEQESGFTLIELLVVILIIGILAAIAIPMFLNQRKSAVDASVQSDLKNAATQVETWMVKNPAGVPDVTSTVGTKTLTGVKVGANTVLKIRSAGVGTYVLCATNAGGDVASTANGFQYDSANGGLKAGTAAC
jgi:type IV pilus assembly protein PilA